MVTGATGVIGGAIAKGLADRGYDVVLAVRDTDRGRTVADPLRATLQSVDLCRRGSVLALGRQFDGPLDVLVNNAAVTPRRRELTPEGLELQWATNVLGYVWLVDALRPALVRAEAPRVVNVASYWAGGLQLDDVMFERRRYDNDAAYRQSKQADRMLTVSQAQELASERIIVNACHPGDLPSTLARNLGFGGGDSPEQAAATPLHLATNPALEGVTGTWWQDRRRSDCRFAADTDAVAALWALIAQWR